MPALVAIIILIIMVIALIVFKISRSAERKQTASVTELNTSMLKLHDSIKIGKVIYTVIAQEENKVLLLSKYFIKPRMHYSGSKEDVSWEHSLIRQYLNDDFYTSLTEAEKAKILKTRLVNQTAYVTERDTEDYIFILSVEELKGYLGEDGLKAECVIQLQDNAAGYYAGAWWGRLCSCNLPSNMPLIFQDGVIECYGDNAGKSGGMKGIREKSSTAAKAKAYIRPAMWIGKD